MVEKINEMSIEELEGLVEVIKNKIKERRTKKQEFSFKFAASGDPRKGKPYVARLIHSDEKLKREFFNLERSWGKNSLTISGEYTARAGDIIEKRVKATWKNDYRYWYLITENGEEVKVAEIDSDTDKSQVIKYLKGEISASELVFLKKI